MTTVAGRPGLSPTFIEGAAGPLFAIYFEPPPKAAIAHRHDVLFIPPFAEEQNGARRSVALQARALARRGIGVLVVDLYGCGDSSGEFIDARWEIWQHDLIAAHDWLRHRGAQRVSLWALRMGSLLAVELLDQRHAAFDRLILWQPVTDGKKMLAQFLRTGVAAGIARGGGNRTTTRDLRANLQQGEVIEVAGYEIAPALATAIEARTLTARPPPSTVPVTWLEPMPDPDLGLSPAVRTVLDAWRDAGARVDAVTVPGDPYWITQEIGEAGGLIAATSELFALESV